MDNPASDLALDKTKAKEKVSWLDIVLAVLVALYGVSTAGAAYMSNKLDGDANEAYFNGVASLNEVNSVQLEYELNFMEITRIQNDFDRSLDEVLPFVFLGYSDQMDALFETGDPVTEEVIDDYLSNFDDAIHEDRVFSEIEFSLAEVLNQDSDFFQIIVLMLAVGLSFVAWASLGNTITTPRIVFTVMATIILVGGLIGLGVSYSSSCGFKDNSALCAIEVQCVESIDANGDYAYYEDLSEDDIDECKEELVLLGSIEE